MKLSFNFRRKLISRESKSIDNFLEYMLVLVLSLQAASCKNSNKSANYFNSNN